SSSTSSSLDSDEDRFQDGLKWEYTEQLESIRVEKVKVKSETKKSVFYFRGVTQVEGTIEERPAYPSSSHLQTKYPTRDVEEAPPLFIQLENDIQAFSMGPSKRELGPP
ncbi:hypothetical protein GN958_ATG18178, partial [Phytophthora infestans]